MYYEQENHDLFLFEKWKNVETKTEEIRSVASLLFYNSKVLTCCHTRKMKSDQTLLKGL